MSIADELKKAEEEDMLISIKYKDKWSPYGKLDTTTGETDCGVVILSTSSLNAIK